MVDELCTIHYESNSNLYYVIYDWIHDNIQRSSDIKSEEYEFRFTMFKLKHNIIHDHNPSKFTLPTELLTFIILQSKSRNGSIDY